MIDPLPHDKREELEAKHGDIYCADTPQGTAYFRRAKRPEILAASQKQKAGQALYGADELCVRCVVWPDETALKALFDRYPLLSDDISAAILAVAKGDESARAGKS